MASKYRAALNAYSTLMEEAKYRLLAMDTALGGQTGLPMGAIHEFCFLQLRMLCELIALGCLVAHGDIKNIGNLRKAYEADKIIRRLQQLHQEFYPRAARQTKAGPALYDAVILEEGFLTKQELVKLYVKCGNILHRGTAKRFLPRQYGETDFREIATWKKKIEVLLGYHVIFMLDNKTIVLFTLRNVDNNNQVQWVTIETKAAMSMASGIDVSGSLE
jgi:hypothetical protein